MLEIDTDAVKCMTDKELAEYLPRIQTSTKSILFFTETRKKKKRLLETLRQKMMLRNRRFGEEEDDRERDFLTERNHLEGKKNAAKSS